MPALQQQTKATVTATTTTEIKLKPQVRRKLLTALKTYAQLHAQIKALETAADKSKDTVQDLLIETGEQSLSLEGFKTTLVSPIKRTLSKEKLVQQGVTMAQIEAATVTTSTKPYVKITAPGEKEREY